MGTFQQNEDSYRYLFLLALTLTPTLLWRFFGPCIFTMLS